MGQEANMVEMRMFCAGGGLIHLDDLLPIPPTCCYPFWGPNNETIAKYSQMRKNRRNLSSGQPRGEGEGKSVDKDKGAPCVPTWGLQLSPDGCAVLEAQN